MRTPIITAPGLMPLDLAERLYQFLNQAMPPTWWQYWEAKDGITCMFNRGGESHFPECWCVMCEAMKFIKSDEFCQKLAWHTGTRALKPGLLFFSHYGLGHGCSQHTDAGNGDIAFVWNLTKDWNIDYGGNLEINDMTIVPTFNQVNVFDVSGGGRPHTVTPVTVDTPKRFALSGWYLKMLSLNELANKHGTDKGDGNYDKHDYAKTYDMLLQPFNGKLKLLELGIWDPRNPGASIRMWREYLPNAEIHGIDVVEGCMVLEQECRIKVHLVNQADRERLKAVMDSIGPVDFVCDDASHIIANTLAAFAVIWPYVTSGGYYVVEDLHAPQAQPRDAIFKLAVDRGGEPTWYGEKLLVVKKP